MSSNLILSDQMSDVVIKVPHGGYSWRFPAHSLLLMSRSDKLREMIEERPSDEHPFIITLIAVHPDTVLALLKYIYTEELPLDVTIDLLLAAEKYGLRGLRNHSESILLPNLTVAEACQLLDGFEYQQYHRADCPIKMACTNMIERHAYRVFGTDLILGLSRRVLTRLMESDGLNVPDESILFWGVWRWGRKNCCQNGRLLSDEVVAKYVDDMLVLIRLSNLRQTDGIPSAACCRFNRCLPRRKRYQAPDDSLEQSTTWRTCDAWTNLVDLVNGERGDLCLQVSFDRNIFLIGFTLEICASEPPDALIQLFRESDRKELMRQEIDCFRSDGGRKLSRTGNAETWMVAEVLLSEPLILPRVEIYSFYLRTKSSSTVLPRALFSPRRNKIQSTAIHRHGQAVVGIRELHLVPDIKVTWR